MHPLVKAIFSLVAFFALSFSASAEYICGVDLNTNGTLSDKGELQSCWDAGTGYLCPIVTAGCQEAFSTAICSDGGTLNTGTDQCELAGGVTCAPGYTFDAVNNLCTVNSTCASSGSLDTTNDVCYKSVVCPSGYNYNSTYKACIKFPTCPTGGSYNSTYDRCIANATMTCLPGYTWNSYWNGSTTVYGCIKATCPDADQNLSYKASAPFGKVCANSATSSTCPTGYTSYYDNWCYEDTICQSAKTFCEGGAYNPVTGKCEVEVTTFIPEMYVYDETLGAYLGDPGCPGGTTYNAATNKCEGLPSDLTCPLGYSLNMSLTGCEALKCPDGTFSNWWSSCGDEGTCYYDKCVANPIVECLSGLTFLGGYCSAAPSCEATAAYNPTINKCVHDANYGCPVGYIYNASVGRCQRAPVCPIDTVYDPVQDMCITPDTIAGICPLGAEYPCESGACVKSYSCGTSFQTMEICLENCDGACSSHCNTDAISALGDVFWTGEVPGYSWFGFTSVVGSGDQLIFYGKNVADDSNIEAGRITMSGCNFEGSASYYTRTGDTCSSTSWGLSAVSANGSSLSFSGGECGQAAGSITVNNCYIDIPSSSSSFDITRVIGTGSSLAFYGGLSGNQQIVSINLCQYSYTCSTCQATKACTYNCPNPSYQLMGDFRCGTFATCPDGGGLSAELDVCEIVTVAECPIGYTLSGSVCVQNPECPTNTSLNPASDRCQSLSGVTCPERPEGYLIPYVYSPSTSKCALTQEITPQYLICPDNTTFAVVGTTSYPSNKCDAPFETATCPESTTLNASTGLCEVAPTGYGTLDTVLDKFKYFATPECGPGWTLNGSVCEKTAACPQGGEWVGGCTNLCVAPFDHTCSPGRTWDASLGRCTVNVTCDPLQDTISSGMWNVKCVSPTVQTTCPVDYSYDSTIIKCATEATCQVGALDPAINYCKVTDNICASGYSIFTTRNRCESSPNCLSPGTYSTTLNKCSTQANFDCPVTYTYVGGNCFKLPDCPNGTYEPVNNQCYDGVTQCSLGDYPCYHYNGQDVCSPYTCDDATNPTGVTENNADLTSPQDNGTVNEEGQCSGQFYVFSGSGNECRPVGTQTVFKNCCNLATAMDGSCYATEITTDQKVTGGVCHYVGMYCGEDWALVGCVQSKKTYCCFGSKLGRIINEQGRPQLKAFTDLADGMWGSPENPECRGFTPEEFQMLDFSQMDLSEFFSEIVNSATTATGDIQGSMSNKINNFYNDTVAP